MNQQFYHTATPTNFKKVNSNTISTNKNLNEEKSKNAKRQMDIERMQQWKVNATKKNEEKKQSDSKNLLSDKLRKTILPKSKDIQPRSSVLLKIDHTSAGRRKNGVKARAIQINEFYPHLFRSKLLKKLKINEIDESLPKIAFAGRSNVGKSSLINALVTKKGMGGKAHVSSKPGETQNVSCYQLSNSLTMIDFPGYGFAFADEEKRLKWQNEIHSFLLNASKMKRVFLLIDVRHGFKESDYTFLSFLNQ